MSTKVTRMVFDRDVVVSESASDGRISGPSKRLLLVYRQIGQPGKVQQKLKLADGGSGIKSQKIPVVNERQDTDRRMHRMGVAMQDIIKQQHAKTGQSTTLCQARTGSAGT